MIQVLLSCISFNELTIKHGVEMDSEMDSWCLGLVRKSVEVD